ncbi:MAG: nucleotidyltransferase domain-containing protein [Bacilli bacterium]|nr:nucleotidyltransferase domain-containing protein [Bacilli bacterium]
MDLKELRIIKRLTQQEAASLVGMSRRGYQQLEYRNNEQSRSYRYAHKIIENYNLIDEEHGTISLRDIETVCKDVFDGTTIEYAYLFGSYSRGEATETSDVDLIFYSQDVKGIEYFGIVEKLRQKLHKKVDLLRIQTLFDNRELLLDIMRDGIKIYAK